MAYEVQVVERPDGEFDVEVRYPGGVTRHVVAVPAALATSLGVDRAELVRASFGFLLEREPPASILRRFSLDVISSYFPEYPEALGRS